MGGKPRILIELQGGAAMEFFRQQQQLRDMRHQFLPDLCVEHQDLILLLHLLFLLDLASVSPPRLWNGAMFEIF